MSRELAYLEIVEKIESTGIEEKFIYDHFPEGAARPMVSLHDDGTKTKALNYVIECLKRGDRVTQGDLGSAINGWLDNSSAACPVGKSPNARSNMLPNGKKGVQFKPEIAKEPEKDHVVDTNKSITAEAPVQPSLAAQQTGTIPPEPPVHRSPPCLGGGGCDQKPSRFRVDKVRGNVCDAIGAPINQLPGNQCPYDVKLPRKSESGFVPASQLATANKDPGIPGGKPAMPDRTLTITFSPDQWGILGKLQTAGVADGYDGAVLFCVDEIGNRSA